jgi:hypothetical protein
MKYTGDIVSTNANTGFMLEEKFRAAYIACVQADKGRLLLSDSSYDIRWRIHTLLWAAKQAEKLEGDFVDCGAGFGLFASAIFSYLNFENVPKNYYLIDTFEGLSTKYSSSEELRRTGNYYTKNNPWYQEIMDSFSKFQNAKIVPGAIPDVLSTVDIDKVSFLSIDMNSMILEKEALQFFWPKLVSGGIIIFDDYGFPGHESQKESHDAFAAANNLLIYTSPTGQGILIKP